MNYMPTSANDTGAFDEAEISNTFKTIATSENIPTAPKKTNNPLSSLEAAQEYVSRNPGLKADQDDHGEIRTLRGNKIVGGKPWSSKPAITEAERSALTLNDEWKEAQEIAEKHGWTAEINSYGDIVTRTRENKIVGGSVSVAVIVPSFD